MALIISYTTETFRFGFKARTSRGLMKDKLSWFITVLDDAHPDVTGVGECGPLPGLSTDDTPDFEATLKDVLAKLPGVVTLADLQANPHPTLDNAVWQRIFAIVPPTFPSIRFGLETALLDLAHGGKKIIFQNEFLQGKPLPINGLIWMGDLDFMMHQVNEKVAQGFRCIKLKVGGLDFDRECEILQYLRKRYFRENITLRLDANGAFKTGEVLFKLTELARMNIHSIEQPIKPGLVEMEELCRKSPISVAFDEELIGVEDSSEKKALLSRLGPAFIILKPTLHGGLAGCAEWISIAESLGMGWWITSALESNVGLNAICQFTANYPVTIPQGLGTGAIYENNVPSRLKVKGGEIFLEQSPV
ncbi:o-succinylbenzoate synthase [Chryseolinea lacunae]|uniref:O-succinylbenzoate synthase n=1 Tax=Chryseolinea lacunae TaxID=2801331 RepID=A0ABS1KZU9_9BACT|nr:o-succinylbenzoate synthase [Chryseolinea lacunae]MBL0744954.1 o-succinylbenzoate synthase [Chryseolinea lacunae]